MGIFTRFKDIISSNINAMLDKAEDPEKLIRLMINEMEETLVELKASCASLMADAARVDRERKEVLDKVAVWENRAKLAVDKGREDLARDALLEKRRLQDRAQGLVEENERFKAMVDQAQDDIARLEEKLEAAREKQRLLIRRHIRAGDKIRTENDLRRASGAEAMLKFDQFEQRIERMEAEASLINPAGRSPSSLEDEFKLLETDDDIENELKTLRTSSGKAEAPKKKETSAKS